MAHVIYQSLNNGYCIGPVAPDDKDAFVEHLKDKRIYDNTQCIPYPYTEGDADRWIQARVLESTATKETLFAIRNRQGSLIGTIDAGSKIIVGEDHASEIGYW